MVAHQAAPYDLNTFVTTILTLRKHRMNPQKLFSFKCPTCGEQVNKSPIPNAGELTTLQKLSGILNDRREPSSNAFTRTALGFETEFIGLFVDTVLDYGDQTPANPVVLS